KRRLAGLLAACAAVAAAAPAPAAAAFQVGIQDDNAFVAAPAFDRARAFGYADRLGVTWLKITLGWDGYAGSGFRPYDVAVHEAAKRADPRAQVLIGELAPGRSSLAFLNQATRRGILADGFAHHPYQFSVVAPGRPDRRYLGISNTALVERTLRVLAARHRLR